MDEEKKTQWGWRVIKFLLGVPIALFYSIVCGKMGANVYVNWVIMVIQNLALYYLCRWEKGKGELANKSFQKWSLRVNMSWWLTSLFSGNFFFFIVGSIWFRLAVFFVGLEDKPIKYLPGLALAIAGKGYTEMLLGKVIAMVMGWAWIQATQIFHWFLSLW